MTEEQLKVVAEYMNENSDCFSTFSNFIWPMNLGLNVVNGVIYDKYGHRFYTLEELPYDKKVCPICGQWQMANVKVWDNLSVVVEGKDIVLEGQYKPGPTQIHVIGMDFPWDNSSAIYMCPYHDVEMVFRHAIGDVIGNEKLMISNLTNFPTLPEVMEMITAVASPGCWEDWVYEYGWDGDPETLHDVLINMYTFHVDALEPFIRYYGIDDSTVEQVLEQLAKEEAPIIMEMGYELEEDNA